MIRFTCDQCKRTLMIRDDQEGRQATCPCGNAFTVPAAPLVRADLVEPASQMAKPISPPPASNLTVTCNHCQRKLLVPATAIGKAVTCRCGKLVVVGTERVPESTPVPVDEFLSRLPLSQRTHQTEATDGPEFWYVNADEPDIVVEGRFVQPTLKEEAYNYLHRAVEEIERQEVLDAQRIDHSVIDAQWVMFVFGTLLAGLYGYRLLNINDIHAEIMQADNATRMPAELLYQYLSVNFSFRMFVGFGLLICGGLTQLFPQTCTITAFALSTVPQLMALFWTLVNVPYFWQRAWTSYEVIGLSIYLGVVAILWRGVVGAIDG